MMIELINSIKEKLKVDDSIEIVLDNSNWRHHTVDGNYTDNILKINLLKEKKGMCYLEFDFAVSWDEEHGMLALTHNNKFFEFAQGGYSWYLD